MNCPKCNCEMAMGYIQSKTAMVWSREKRKLLFLPKFEDDVWIDSIDGVDAFGLTGVHKEAYCCPECSTIVI